MVTDACSEFIFSTTLCYVIRMEPFVFSGYVDSEHEYLRRKIEGGLQEFWFFIKDQFHQLSNTQFINAPRVAQTAMENAGEHYR